MKARYLLSLLLCVLLSACGFHLRGIIEIPEWLNNVSIISRDGDKDLISKMKTQLEGYKIDVNPDPSKAKYWLIINKSNVHQQIISIGASTTPRQYQLIMTTVFSLQTPTGQVIKTPKQITVTRQLTVNNNRILGSNEEENILLSEMHQDTVIQILNRISHK
ncbi:LPS assembly lipoprotein LptE [Legionella worsleiensis]|uniref:LPS-assembly lipoprotein LptE n=1 Tax=Legionella worsleiensis TaxID=45076 RepID=A0A0W1AL37_9GAMM|nr:LPS assembly lipoprotein LptE [Legionella worsleiensis]KTD82039.1 rare lipoprotein B [Legionella worsleiensis]STY30289.1 Rare lipoprotein B [Legionella worsleiensis]